ncbi:MAG TPA: YncE family protein, partial [Nitrososphaeraceae archaeon]|nr:YncE family protein [Nitrososphaeraceae archaeon]
FEDDFQGTVSAINGTSKQEIDNVNVSYATTIALDVNTDKIYLPQNEESITVIPISDYNEDHFDDIFIDEMKGLASQEDIAINPNTNLLYVITDEGKRLSEIDSYTGIVLNDFGIPGFATDIAVNPESNVAYVTSQFSNSVSAINLTAGAGLANVTVDVNPQAVSINPETNKVYVANRDSSTVSVIDGHTNKAIAGATFKVNPSNSGYIQCAHSTSPSPTEQYIYVWSDHACIATPNKGYEFVSWEQNLQGNSTQVIQASAYASIWDSILDFFGSKLEEPEATLNMSKFGNFTANFKEIPPPVSSEYLIPLYGIIITTIVGWSIPSIIGWTKSKRDVGKLNYYHKQITSLYGDGKLDENDIGALDRLRSNIVDAYSKGKLNEKHYDSLRNETSILYDKIFRKRIDDALNNNNDPSNNETMDEQFKKIRNDIKYAYSEGKINDKHFDLLNKYISDLQNKKE